MKKWNKIFFAGLMVVMFMLAACAPAASEVMVEAAPADVQEQVALEVSVDEASALREAGAFMLDVREDYEWVDGHIPGATWIPLGELASRVDEVPQDQLVVVYCRSGNRSQVGRNTLLEAGFTNVTSMAGGFSTWASSGYKTETGE